MYWKKNNFKNVVLSWNHVYHLKHNPSLFHHLWNRYLFEPNLIHQIEVEWSYWDWCSRYSNLEFGATIAHSHQNHRNQALLAGDPVVRAQVLAQFAQGNRRATLSAGLPEKKTLLSSFWVIYIYNLCDIWLIRKQELELLMQKYFTKRDYL